MLLRIFLPENSIRSVSSNTWQARVIIVENMTVANDGWVYVLGPIASIVIVVNMSVLALIRSTLKKVDTYSVFVVNQSISDLLVGCIIIVYICVPHNNTNIVAEECIRFIESCGLSVSLCLSELNILFLTVIRYKVTTDPLFNLKLRRITVIKICLILWTTSSFIIVPQHIILRTHVLHQKQRHKFEGITTAAIGILSFPLLCYCFRKIIKTQRKSREFGVNLENSSCLLSKCRLKRRNAIRRLKEKKSTTIAVITVAAFTMCWFPYCGYHVTLPTGVWDRFNWAGLFHEYFHALTYCNSCISASIFICTALVKYLKNRWLSRSRATTTISTLSSD